MTSALFSPIAMRGLTLPNRIVVSPMCQYNSNDGSANDWHLMHLGSFSLGAAGLVMTEMTDVNPVGRITSKCAGLWSDANEAALKRVHDFCRTYGVAKLGVQLAHAGRKGSTQTPAAGGKPLSVQEGGWIPEAPSALPYDNGWPVPHAMTKDDIKRCVAEFAAAAQRVERIGYDLIELHGGHGYLLHQFMSPLSNQRTDEYGGSTRRTAFAFRSKCSRPCARRSPPRSRSASACPPPTGSTAAGRPEETVVLARELKNRRLRLHGRLERRARSAPKDSARARLPGAVRREGAQGDRHQDHVGRTDRRRAPGRGHHRVRAEPISSCSAAASCTIRAGPGTRPRSSAPRRPMRRR